MTISDTDRLLSRAEQRNEWFNEMESVKLPQWLEDCIPDSPPVRVIKVADDGASFIIVDSKNKICDSGFKNIIEAYDSIYGSDVEIIIDRSVDHVVVAGNDVTVTKEAFGRGNRILFTQSFKNSLSILKSNYKTWVEETHPAWLADPNDWVKSYQWLQDHPVFWTRKNGEKTARWDTQNGVTSLYTVVGKQEGKTLVMFEHGPHYGDFSHHAHDTRTESYEETFEEAYVSLARKFHQYYHSDGTDRCENSCCGTYSEISPCNEHTRYHEEVRSSEGHADWANFVEECWRKFGSEIGSVEN